MILHWNYRNLKELPQELLQNGQHIKEIYLKGNSLTSLPKDVGKLRNLTNLYLIGNRITILPSEIEELESLRYLDFGGNLLQYIPSSIGNMKKLEHLVLTQNYISYLPKELGHLKSLKSLELSGNKIYYIPDEAIRGLESLQEFAIDGNPITHLPSSITSLQNLRYISACRCNLLFLPAMPFYYLVNGKRADGNFTPTSAISQNMNENRPLSGFKLLFDNNPNLNFLPIWVIQLMGRYIEVYGCGFTSSNGNLSNEQKPTSCHPHKTVLHKSGLKVKLRIQGEEKILYFDEDLARIHNETASYPTSLLEQCLRVVYTEDLHRSPYPDKSTEVVEPHLTYSSRSDPTVIFSSASETLYERSKSTMEIGEDDNPQLSLATHQSNNPMPKPAPSLPPNLNDILIKGVVSRCFMCLKPIFTDTWLVIFRVPKMSGNPQPDPGPGVLNVDHAEEGLLTSCIYLCSKTCRSKIFGQEDSTAQSCLYRQYIIDEIKFQID